MVWGVYVGHTKDYDMGGFGERLEKGAASVLPTGAIPMLL